MSKTLLLKDVLAIDDVIIEKVPVQEWGGDVYLRNLRGWQRDKFDQKYQPSKEGVQDLTHFRASLVAASWCDEQGNFQNPTPDDIIKLSDKNAAPLDRLFDVARVLSGIGKRDAAEKKSETPTGDSGSDSQ